MSEMMKKASSCGLQSNKSNLWYKINTDNQLHNYVFCEPCETICSEIAKNIFVNSPQRTSAEVQLL